MPVGAKADAPRGPPFFPGVSSSLLLFYYPPWLVRSGDCPSLIAYISDDDYDEGLEAITATGDLLVPNRLAPTRLAGTESCAGPRPRGVVSNLDLGSTLRISSTGGAKPMAVLVRRGVNRRGRYSQMTSWTGLTASVTSLRP